MPFDIVAFLFVLVSLGVIIFIVSKKYSQLILLDVDNIPAVKQDKKKDEYLAKKIEKHLNESKKGWMDSIKPIIQRLKEIQLAFRKYVGKVEREVMRQRQQPEKQKAKPVTKQELTDLETILKEAGNAFDNEFFDEAEEKYIAAIKIDARNTSAYKGLADVYFKQNQLDEAKETYNFLLQLDPNEDSAYVKLADIAEQKGNVQEAVEQLQQAVLINDQISTRFVRLAELLRAIDEPETALEAIQQAVELEPQNPKYLDILTELAIMVGDQKLAETSFNQLRMVNPENQKLDVLRGKIDKIQ